MGAGDMQVKRAKVGIHDVYRGVFLNRGMFIKAPPGFFEAYPADFEPPPQNYEKLANIHVRTISTWDEKAGLLRMPEPKVEVPVPQGTPIAEVSTQTAPATTEPVAMSKPRRSPGRRAAIVR